MNEQIHKEPDVQPTIADGHFGKLNRHMMLDVTVILACALLIFGRTLSSYFLADDFGEIDYVQKIFAGDMHRLLATMTGNYMEIAGMSVYRPFLLLSLMIDFLLWRSNAFGYYLTNFSFYFFDAVLLYLIIRKLAPATKELNNRLTAVFAAALFAVSPLHCESVSWVVGRVDIICAFFYLLSVYLIPHTLNHKSKKLTALAITAFISALLVKEMAIGIPLLAFALSFLYEKSGAAPLQRFKNAVAFALPYLAATVFYFIVRYACLGTLIGGYVAGFGTSQEVSLVARWFDPDIIKRFAFPLIAGQFPNEKLISMGLTVFYVTAGTLFVLRMLAGLLPMRFFSFLLLWAITTLLPIYKLWGLGFHLEGARFVFFLTLPLSAFFAACLFQDKSKSTDQKLRKSFLLVSCAVAMAGLLLYSKIALKTNSIWINAGKQVRSTGIEARRILQEQGPTAVFLGIPREWLGTHMILNGETFLTIINPPFAAAPPKRKFAVLEPVMYSAVHDFDAPRLKRLLARGAQLFVWNVEKRVFEPRHFTGLDAPAVRFDAKDASGRLETSGSVKKTSSGFEVSPGSLAAQPTFILNNLDINPLSCDYLSVRLQLKNPRAGISYPLRAEWKSADEISAGDCFVVANAEPTGQEQTVLLPLSRRWAWFQSPSRTSVTLEVPAANLEVKSLALESESTVAPALSLKTSEESKTGVFSMSGASDTLTIDASGMADAAHINVEIGKCNFFFDTFRNGNSQEAVEKTLTVSLSTDKKATIKLPRSGFAAGKGYFQIRARALGADNKPLGAYSSFLTIKLD